MAESLVRFPRSAVRNPRSVVGLVIALVASLTSAGAQRQTEGPRPIPIRVVVVTMFEHGVDALLTAGFNEADGAGGGGLVPFAFVTGYGSDESYGANVHYTYAPLRDFDFTSYGIAVGLLDRVELTFARQDFEATDTALDGVSVSR